MELRYSSLAVVTHETSHETSSTSRGATYGMQNVIHLVCLPRKGSMHSTAAIPNATKSRRPTSKTNKKHAPTSPNTAPATKSHPPTSTKISESTNSARLPQNWQLWISDTLLSASVSYSYPQLFYSQLLYPATLTLSYLIVWVSLKSWVIYQKFSKKKTPENK